MGSVCAHPVVQGERYLKLTDIKEIAKETEASRISWINVFIFTCRNRKHALSSISPFIDADAAAPFWQDEDEDEDLERMWRYLDIGADGYMSEEQFLGLMSSDYENHL